MGAYLRAVLCALSTLRNRSGGYIQVLGPPDPGQAHGLFRLPLLHGPEESGAPLPWGIFDETGRNGADEVVMCV